MNDLGSKEEYSAEEESLSIKALHVKDIEIVYSSVFMVYYESTTI